MKVKLDKITAVEVEVEMPDACPHCGEDWRPAVKENQLMLADQTGYDFDEFGSDVGLSFGDYDAGENFYDGGTYVTGYTCVHCDKPIVTTEVEPQVGGEDARST